MLASKLIPLSKLLLANPDSSGPVFKSHAAVSSFPHHSLEFSYFRLSLFCSLILYGSPSYSDLSTILRRMLTTEQVAP